MPRHPNTHEGMPLRLSVCLSVCLATLADARPPRGENPPLPLPRVAGSIRQQRFAAGATCGRRSGASLRTPPPPLQFICASPPSPPAAGVAVAGVAVAGETTTTLVS